RIIRGPRGEHGFGYDPIFEPDDQPNRTNPDGSVLTSAQLTADEKNAISHRGKAIKALMPAVDRMLDAVRRR
ncbi:MAG: non-canonical purine NTP pyrophosphatase, partial [Bifidobacterium mongoliense]|nr:non-canonical purine NTP pyrophosphatase [Bifidobacterium mongoliense]